ncbi:MAG: YceI family protein [Planctomycetota bacterium]
MRTTLRLTTAAAAGAALLFALVGATSSSTEAMDPTPTPKPAATTYSVDLGHSNILFRCKHLGVAYQWGRFDKFEGSFTLADDASASNVSITVDAASVNSNSPDRDKHLRAADFFSVKEFPEMTFASSKVAKKSDDIFTITGDLTLHGVTKEISFDVTKIGEADTGRMGRRAGFEGSFVIDRMDYGVKAYPDMLGQDVTMTFAIEGVAKK